MNKIIVVAGIILACLGVGAYAESSAKMLDYYDGLMEYYAGYCDAIGPKEREEAYMVMYPGKYELHEKDEKKKQEDIADVDAKLKKVIPVVQKGTHEYTMVLRGEIGAYDTAKAGFSCIVARPHSFLDLAPRERGTADASGENAGQSIVSRGVLFGKVSRIKLVFINADDFGVLPYPSEKAAVLLKSRTDARGNINKEIYASLTMEILPRDKCRPVWDGIMQNVYTPGIESNYFMIARIKRIEIFDDMVLQHKLGNIGAVSRELSVTE
jgi:hypothetical protein